MISTPCINVCVLEPETKLCIGCGRSSDEIAQWSALDEATRREIMAGLPDRLRRLTARPRTSDEGPGRRRLLPSRRRQS